MDPEFLLKWAEYEARRNRFWWLVQFGSSSLLCSLVVLLVGIEWWRYIGVAIALSFALSSPVLADWRKAERHLKRLREERS